MDTLSRDDLQGLIQTSDGRCVSIFFPTQRYGKDVQQNAVRLKNLLNDAERQLDQRGHDDLETKKMLQQARGLIEDRIFWQHQSEGLALFLSPQLFRTYRLPIELDEQLVIGDRFYLLPLVPALTGDGRFYILALSQNHVRLLRGTRNHVEELELEGVPLSKSEALRYDEYGENQYYTNTTSAIAAGRGTAHYAGSGMSLDDNDDNLRRYLQKVDRGLHQYLRDEQAPLVLAGVEYLLPIYREVNTYGHLVEQPVTGNPDDLRPEELHQQAWQMVQPIFQRGQQEAADRYRRFRGANPALASNDVKDVVSAAFFGRVDALFVPRGTQVWGTFDSGSNRIDIHDTQQPGDEDLLDLAAVHTILNNGAVYAVDAQAMPEPDQGPVAAVYRY